MNRNEVIEKLLEELHISSLERSIFQEVPLTIGEIEEVIKLKLEGRSVFPSNASIWTEGNAVFEGYFIQRLDKGYKLHWQRHQAINPFLLTERNADEFDSLTKVVCNYIKREYNFSIDGVEVLSIRNQASQV